MSRVCFDHVLVVKTMEAFVLLKVPEYEDKFIGKEEAMRLMQITSPTTLQNMRNQRRFDYYQLTNKHIIYDKQSIIEYIVKNKVDKF